MICEKCGHEMNYFNELGSCGWICPHCDNGVATTYLDPIKSDYNVYSLSLNPIENPDITLIKLVSKMMDCNFVQAKNQILEGTVTVSAKANDILSYATNLFQIGVTFAINPDFPYEIK